jgi:hypothetical protein
MQTNLLIVDNFYNDPDSIREYALAQDFSVRGNYPGQRTKPVHHWDCREVIQNIIQYHGGEITFLRMIILVHFNIQLNMTLVGFMQIKQLHGQVYGMELLMLQLLEVLVCFVIKKRVGKLHLD